MLYNLHIMSARFPIQFKELSTEMVTRHKEMVMTENKNYIISHTKVSMKMLNIPSGGRSYTFDNVFKGKFPDRIALAMVADATATGSYTANPFNFQNFLLNYIALGQLATDPPHHARTQLRHPRLFKGISHGDGSNGI